MKVVPEDARKLGFAMSDSIAEDGELIWLSPSHLPQNLADVPGGQKSDLLKSFGRVHPTLIELRVVEKVGQEIQNRVIRGSQDWIRLQLTRLDALLISALEILDIFSLTVVTAWTRHGCLW